jgi:hypothetical protein
MVNLVFYLVSRYIAIELPSIQYHKYPSCRVELIYRERLFRLVWSLILASIRGSSIVCLPVLDR